MDRLKLLNGRNGRKESPTGNGPVRVYALAHPQPGPEPQGADLTDLARLRIYCVADLLSRALAGDGRRVQWVERAEEAALVVGPAGFGGGSRAALLAVAPPQVNGEVGPYSLAEARYLTLSAPHAVPLVWSAGALAGAKAALGRLGEYGQRLKETGEAVQNDPAGWPWRDRFYTQLNDDLNTPRALAVLWTLLQSDETAATKYSLLSEFASTLGLNRALGLPEARPRPAPVTAVPPLSSATPDNPRLARPLQLPKEAPRPTLPPQPQRGPGSKKPPLSGFEGAEGRNRGKPGTPGKTAAASTNPEPLPPRRRLRQSREVRSYLNEPDRFDFTVSLISADNLPEVRRTVESLRQYIPRSPRKIEVVAVEMGQPDVPASADYLEGVAAGLANFRLVYAEPGLGEAAGRNVAFRQGRGRYVVILEAGVRLTGDLFEKLQLLLPPDETASPALYGVYPLALTRQEGAVKGFAPVELSPQAQEEQEQSLEVEALDGPLLVVRRNRVEEVGFMDEHFRFPYALSLDYSLAHRDKGYGVRALPGLARLLELPATRPTYGLTPEQQTRQREKNWQLFLRSWDSLL